MIWLVLDTEPPSVKLIGSDPDGSRLMRKPKMHVKGMIAGAAAALWMLVVVGSAHTSMMSSPVEPPRESSSDVSPAEQGTPDHQDYPVLAVASTEGEESLVEPVSVPTNDPALPESATRVRVPTDGIRKRIDAVGEVVGQPTGRVLVSVNDVVTLKFHRGEEPQPHQRYVIARRGQFVEHPESGRNLGYVVHVVGTVELDQAFGRYWSGRIVSATDFVSIDDLLLPFDEPIDAASDAVSSNKAGRIVAVQDDLALTATAQIVFTDLGADDGVNPGDEYVIIRDGVSARRGSTDRFIGMLRVVATQPKSSSAYITRSSEPIEIGDRLEHLASTASAQ
jgi:hypothetical protein